MKPNDQTLLKEAYDKVLFDKGKQSIEELTKEIGELKERLKKSYDENDKKQLNKIIKAKMEKRAELVGKKSINEEEEQDFSYYSGPAEDVMFLDDLKDASNLKRKVEGGKTFKTAFVASKTDAVNYGYPEQSGHQYYVFYTPQDFTRPALIPI